MHRIAPIALVLLLALTAASCTGCASRPATPPPVPTPSPTPTPAPSSTPTPSPIAGMTPRQLAGQRVIYGYAGLTPPDELLDLIRHGEAAGVIFFGDNISSEAQLRRVIAQFQKANAAPTNPVRAPLLMMVDQEGGVIRRLPGPPASSERQIGDSADAENLAATAGRDTGRYLRDIGLNVDLAPVLDVYRRDGDFSDRYGRSYSRDPGRVGVLGTAFIRALQGQGVAATAKHFPGLGSATTTQNTDARPVTLKVPERTLADVDVAPFRSAVSAGVKLVMVSWATYPAIDASAPAGLSPIIVGQRLREQLGFSGVIVSDSIQADALKPFGRIGTRATKAADAGIDLIVCGKAKTGIGTGVQARDGLAAAYRNRALDADAFDESVLRVIALRMSLAD